MSTDLIDGSSQIHKTAEIGNNVRIDPWCSIGKNVRIGDPSFEPAVLELCMHTVCRYLNLHNFYGIDELDYIW